MTLNCFWLSLNCLARSLTHSLLTAVIECHQWISVWARADADRAPSDSASRRVLGFMRSPEDERPMVPRTTTAWGDIPVFRLVRWVSATGITRRRSGNRLGRIRVVALR